MLTIGLAHLADLIRYLQSGQVQIDGLRGQERDLQPLETELELVKQSIGVTVIVPRSLCDLRPEGAMAGNSASPSASP